MSRWYWTLILLSVWACNGQAADKTLTIATLEWPPYVSESLPKNGFATEIARQAFLAEGYQIKLSFYPWSRALKMVRQDKNTDACMFAYYSKERAEEFTFSDPVGASPIGFAERKDHEIHWRSYSDLKPYHIGVVQDYVNEPELDRQLQQKTIFSETALDDETNLMKLSRQRVDLTVVDINVFHHLIGTNPLLRKFKKQLEINDHLIENKKIYLIFKKDKEGQELAKVFNRGLKKINAGKIIHEICKECVSEP